MAADRGRREGVDYREWQRVSVKVGGTLFPIATKPGVFAHGRLDPSALMLSERVAVAPGDVVVSMNGGNGLFAAVASVRGGAGRVVLTDRNVLAVEAATRTLAANGVRNGEVLLTHGAGSHPTAFRADVVAIRIPQERLALLQLLHDAFRVLKVGGKCYIAGATNEGIKTAARTLEKLFGSAIVLARDSTHRLVVAAKRSDTPGTDEELSTPYVSPDAFNELRATLRGRELQLFTRPGTFSWDHVDEATQMLASAMQVNEGESVLDLGCGCGALGIAAAGLSRTGSLTMVDADVEAVRSAARSAEANGVARFRALPSDVASAVLEERFDVVVTNPPFHVGKATDLDVPLQFIRDAWQVLAPGGRMYLVANRTLPYERAVARQFGNIATLHDGARFKVLAATKQEAP
jgi:16S rRNA (guanine1207-N2)-methyltransferase